MGSQARRDSRVPLWRVVSAAFHEQLGLAHFAYARRQVLVANSPFMEESQNAYLLGSGAVPKITVAGEIDHERCRTFILGDSGKGRDDLLTECYRLPGHIFAVLSRAVNARQHEPDQIGMMVRAPRPLGRLEARIIFEERQVSDRASGENLLGTENRDVQRAQRSRVHDEARFRERPSPRGAAHEVVYAQASIKVMLNKPQHHEVRVPGANVAQISQIGLVDAISGDSKV